MTCIETIQMAVFSNNTLSIESGRSLRAEMALFMLASALDWLMTVFLLKSQSSNGEIEFIESNPVASFFLNDWGFTGLFGFKATMVLVIAACCLIIAVRRIQVARLVLRFGVVSVSLVVVYSAALALRNT